MDKYEYKLRADEIKTLIGEGRYAEAAQIADTIDWKKVKSVRTLCTISDLYKINRRYEDSREILLIANNHYPDGRYIIYSLCELSIKLQDIFSATEYFKEFARIAPYNTSRYILQYKLYVAQDVSLEERIAVLKEFKKHDYREKWGYELAFLYHRVGLATECVEECDELFLWFGRGRFVIKALELKKLHEPLSPEQQKVYDRSRGGAPEPEKAPAGAGYDDERDEMGHDESQTPPPPAKTDDGEFHVKEVDPGEYSTINLQQVIAESLRELQKKPAGQEVPQDTRVIRNSERAQRSAGEAYRVLADNTADTGILGITEEDLNAFEEDGPEEAQGGREQGGAPEERAEKPAGPDDAAAVMPGEPADGMTAPEDSAAAESLRQTAASIATDDTIWMPGINDIARYAAEQGQSLPGQPEISAATIAQATGEMPVPEEAAAVQEPPHADPVMRALQQPPQERWGLNGMPVAAGLAAAPAAFSVYSPANLPPVQSPELRAPMEPHAAPAAREETTSPEKRLVDELQNEVLKAGDDARRLRAAERRAELKSREQNGRVREVSSNTRRLGQTREYVPVTHMDRMLDAALGGMSADGRSGVSAPILREDLVTEGQENGKTANVVYPSRRKSAGTTFDDLLTQSPDGQLSMAVDEREELEKQITGQISINDFLTGWESYKKAQQERRDESLRERVRQDADDMFRGYDERRDFEESLLAEPEEEAKEETFAAEPGAAGTRTGTLPAEPPREELRAGTAAAEPEEEEAGAGALPAEPLREELRTEEPVAEPEEEETGAGTSATEPEEAEIRPEESSAESPEEETREEELPAEPRGEEPPAGALPTEVRKEQGDVETAAADGSAAPAAYAGPAQDGGPAFADLPREIRTPAPGEMAEAPGAVPAEEAPAGQETETGAPEAAQTADGFPLDGDALTRERETGEIRLTKNYDRETGEIILAGILEEEAAAAAASAAAAHASAGAGAAALSVEEEIASLHSAAPHSAADGGEQAGQNPEEPHRLTREEIAHQLAVLEGRISSRAPQEAPTGQEDEQELHSGEGEAMQPAPTGDAVRAATGQLPSAGAVQEAAGSNGDASSEETLDDHVLRVMTPEEKELFGPYIHKKRSRQQIITAIDSLSLAAYAGNAIITGEEGAGTINLAKGLIRSVQLSDSNFSGQIAKITGSAMNRKRVDAIVDKLSGGALIIQGAAGMNNETTKALMDALQSENRGIIVVLEDTRKRMDKYLRKHPEIRECFSVRVDVEPLATRELVAYAKQYALDREFSMDEFAVLALHKRIDEMQTAEHEVTITEVRDIVDEAIHRANRKNPAHFFDILLQKRYDDEDMIILREKDFLR